MDPTLPPTPFLMRCVSARPAQCVLALRASASLRCVRSASSVLCSAHLLASCAAWCVLCCVLSIVWCLFHCTPLLDCSDVGHKGNAESIQ